MSDTPISDKAASRDYAPLSIPYEVAQQMERELNEANAKIAELESMRENWRVSSVCRDLKAHADALADALGMKECFGHPSCALQNYRTKYPKP